MQQQNRILETVSSPEGLTRVSALMSAESFSHRTAVADRVCKAFGFWDARGRQQRAGCLKALRALDAKGCIALPAPRHRGGGGQPRGLGQAVAAPSGVPDRVNEVEDLALILVSSAEQRRVWNELMAREHPQGAARHVGAQVRYLILSRHGCLGAFGFAASALMLAARDRWIGWDPALRAQQLHRVVAMSRFLIRPGVRCHNLASKVLGMCLRRLADDFARRYGYSPLLVETFVDSSCQAGTSLKASNWILVGETCGRGRFAPAGVQVPVKSIYMYPLQPAWREQLGLATREPIPALGPGEGLDRAQWAETRPSCRPTSSSPTSRSSPWKTSPKIASYHRPTISGVRCSPWPCWVAISTANVTRRRATRNSGKAIPDSPLPHRPTRDCSGWTGPAISIGDCVPTRLVGKRQGAGVGVLSIGSSWQRFVPPSERARPPGW